MPASWKVIWLLTRWGPESRVAAACLTAGAVVPLAGQALPPLNELNHEFTQMFTLLTTPVLYYASAWLARSTTHTPGLSPTLRLRLNVTLLMGAALLMAAVALAVMALANHLGPGCRFGNGVPFYWITWLPTAALAIVGGAVLGTRGWRWLKLTGMLALVILLSLVQDLFQVLSGVNLVDFLVGMPLALDQRATILPPRLHLYQRLMVLLGAVGLYTLALWRAERRRRNGSAQGRLLVRTLGLQAGLIFAAWLLTILGAGSTVGLGWGNRFLRAHLRETRRTDHFIFHYAPLGPAEGMIDGIARHAEWCWHELCGQWKITPARPVHVYLFNSGADLQELTGLPDHALIRTVYLTSASATGSTLLHELVHALQINLHPHPAVILNRGIVEGLATAYEDDYAFLPQAHRRQAGALALGKLPSAARAMSASGFWRVNEGNAYQTAGSFIGFLILQHGFDKFRQFQHSLDYRAVYGQDLGGLDQQWRRFLATVNTDLETQLQGAESFDSDLWPNYLAQCCAKLGERSPRLEQRVSTLWLRRDYTRAARLYRELYARDGKLQWAFQLAQCQRALGQVREAVAVLDDLSGVRALTDYERGRLLRAKIPCLMQLQDWPALYAAFDEQNRLRPPSPDAALLQAGLHRAEVRAPIARALLADDPYEQRRLLEQLVDSQPNDTQLCYLYATRALRYLPPVGFSLTPDRKAQVLALLHLIEKAPDAADRLAAQLLSFASDAVLIQEFDLAETIAKPLAQQARLEINRYRSRKLLQRIAFERAYQAEKAPALPLNLLLHL